MCRETVVEKLFMLYFPPLDVYKDFPDLSSEYHLHIVVIKVLYWHYSYVNMNEFIFCLLCKE